MRSLSVPATPPCLATIATARPNGPWFDGDDLAERQCRVDTRVALLANQMRTCGWCGSKITQASSHTDHILPKSNPAHAALTFAIGNLIACCGATGCQTCGHRKGNREVAGWIHPYQTVSLESCFTYEIDGKMAPHPSLAATAQAEALDAIETILNLNDSVLKSQREALIDEMLNTDTYEQLTHDDIFTIVGEFKPLIEQYTS